MSKRKLELYENLFKHLGPGMSSATISDISGYLQCSERHTRTLLKHMASKGWLTWKPSRGRGLRGELSCLVEPISACYQEMDNASKLGKYELAHKLVGFNERDTASGLKQYLTQATTSSEDTIYAPFHRQINWLHPHHAMERTERHLIHEIYQTLVACEATSLHGELAHSWKTNHNGSEWVFYLCAGAKFHDLSLVTSADVIASLEALIHSNYWRHLYDHVLSIKSLSPHSVIIQLSEPDPHFAQLLCRSEAAIMPQKYVHSTSKTFKPIGSGPFSLDINSEKLIRLQRFGYYNRCSALVGKIELWIHEEWAKEKRCAENFFFLNDDEEIYKVSTSNIGYFFIMLNRPELQNSTMKTHLLTLLGGDNNVTIPYPFPIQFSYENNSENRAFSNELIASQAKNNGFSHAARATQVVYGKPIANQDLSIGGIRLEGDEATSLFSFFKLYPFWQRNLNWKQQQRMEQVLGKIRSSDSQQQRLALAHELLNWLNEDNVLAIVRSEDLTLTVPARINGVEINSIGWCDFSKLWIEERHAAHSSKGNH